MGGAFGGCFSASDGEGCDTDFQVFHCGEGIAAADEGGAGGEDIVDEENMAAFKLFGMFDTEGSLDIALALGSIGEALLTGVAVTDEGFAVHLAVHHFRDAATKQFALVIATLETSSPVERHGN